jgi:hypothetical protein
VQDDDPQFTGTKILLNVEIVITGHEGIERAVGASPQEFAVATTWPPLAQSCWRY